MLNWKTVCWSLALTTAISFVLCVVWGLITPEALHMHGFLEQLLPGFTWLSPANFALGLIESFLWGFYGGIVFVPIHNFLHKRWG
jgi:hypothetical protein